MLAAIDIYPPFSMPYIWLCITLGIIALIVGGHFVVRWLLRHAALKRQQRAAIKLSQKDPELVSHALSQLENLKNAYQRNELSPDAAAEQVSALVRETYDQAMNHRTRYQAKYEIAARNLSHVAKVTEHAYPVEFSKVTHELAPAAVESLFAKAKETIEQCR